MPELLPFIFHFSFLHFSLKLSASSTSMSLGSASGSAAASCWLRLGESVARSHLSVCVFVRPELKFEPGYFHPCWLHVSDVSHEVFVLLTRQPSAGDRWSRESRPHPCLPYPHGGSAHRGCCHCHFACSVISRLSFSITSLFSAFGGIFFVVLLDLV